MDIKLSFRQDHRISGRDGLISLARWNRSDVPKVTEKNIHNLTPECREAYETADSGRQSELAGSQTEVIVQALAQNPALHPDVQMMLTRDPRIKVRNSLTKNDNLTEEVQLRLMKDKFDVKDSLSKNPHLSEAVQLAKDKQSPAVIENLSENPGLTFESIKLILPKISVYRFKKICEHASDLETQSYLYEFAKAKNEQERASERHYYSWRNNILAEFAEGTKMLPEIKQKVMDDILKSKDPHFVTTMLDKVEVDENILERIYKRFSAGIIKKENEEVLKQVAGKTTNPEIQKYMYENGYAESVIGNPSLSKSMAINIINASDDQGVLRSIAEKFGGEGEIDEEIAMAILNKPMEDSGSGYYRSARLRVAERASVKLQKMLINMYADLDDSRKSSLASAFDDNSYAGPDAQKYIIQYSNEWDAGRVAEKTTFPEVQEFILSKNNSDLLAHLMKNKTLSSEIRARMLSSSDSMELLKDVAEDTELSPEESVAIFNRAVAINQNQPLDEDNISPFVSTLEALGAKAPNPQLLVQILQYRNRNIWRGIAKNPHLPKELQKSIAESTFTNAKNSLADRNDLTPEVQAILVKSPDMEVKQSLFESTYQKSMQLETNINGIRGVEMQPLLKQKRLKSSLQ